MTRLLRHWPWVALLACGAILAAAHAFETFGHLAPCALCLKERDVYWLAMVIAGFGAAVDVTPLGPRWTRVISGLLGLVFVWSAGLAAYHAGVEWKWWPGPTSCSGGAGRVDAAALTALLNGAKMSAPACDKAPFVFLGLSMAGWNAAISLGLAVLSAVAAFRRPIR